MVNRKLNGGKQPFTNLSSPAGAPVPKLDRQIKPQKTGILQRSLGVSVNSQRAPGANLSTGYPQLLWITFVEFGSFS